VGKSYLVKGENSVNMLARNILRNGNFSLVIIARHYLGRIVPQLLIAEWPEIHSTPKKEAKVLLIRNYTKKNLALSTPIK